MLEHVVGFVLTPHREWEKVDRQTENYGGIVHILLLGLIPVLAFYYGVTVTGWEVADGETVRIAPDDAQLLVALFYLAMLGAIAVVGYLVHWMAISYGSESSTLKGITLVGYCATPMFLSGLVGFIPIVWVDMLVAVAAVSYSLFLLYDGIPVVMHIPKERGFLFASAIVAVCLVILISMMGVTVWLWDIGFMPEFTD